MSGWGTLGLSQPCSSVYPECNVQMFLLRYIYLKHWVNKHICDPSPLLLQKVQVQMYNIMSQH